VILLQTKVANTHFPNPFLAQTKVANTCILQNTFLLQIESATNMNKKKKQQGERDEERQGEKEGKKKRKKREKTTRKKTIRKIRI
jgi:hypothetical protein